MKPTHYLLLSLLGFGALSCSQPDSYTPLIQAHRGGAAIYPENTIPAMLHAVDLGVPVLEMDMHISKDSLVIVSHDAYLNPAKALTPEGDTIAAGDKSHTLYSMPYDSIRRYDVGTRFNPAFPHKASIRCEVPLISQLIDTVENHVKEKALAPVSYNIEIKSSREKDGVLTPDYRTFTDLCMKVLLSKNLGDRLLIQSFDTDGLNYLHEKYPDVRLAYLISDEGESLEELMAKINFTPQVFSPESSWVTAERAKQVHAMHMQLIPWTVDTKEEALRLKALHADEIITNRPDSMQVWLQAPAK